MAAVALAAGFATGASAETVTDVPYRYPVYNAADVPASGIKEWKTGTHDATAITSQTTWGTAGQDTWYVVNATKTISSRITCNGNVHLVLADGCTLTASAGVTVSGSNSLTVYGQDADSGALIATSTYWERAGIGGDGYQTTGLLDSGRITINGGAVTAKGGKYSAGIGGGYQDATAAGTGTGITINGGTVTAQGDSSGSWSGAACIGGGSGAEGRDIVINGGSVSVVMNNNPGAGIGGGQYGAGRDITVNGGTVTATRSGSSGAGVGGGQYGIGQDITVNGGDVIVQQTSGTGNGNGAGIGGGQYAMGRNIAVNGGTVTVTQGAVNASRNGAGIGGGANGDGLDITINGGTVTVAQEAGTSNGAGIGGGASGAGRDIAVNGGTVTVSQTAGTSNGAGIGGGGSGVGQGIAINDGQVNVSFYAGYGAGIGGGSGSAGRGLDITINGGTVDVQFGTSSSSYGAGVGGGRYAMGSGIAINGGTVTVEGGNGGGAGIGGGSSGAGQSIAINGGTVTATGGSANAHGVGAGQYGRASDVYAAADVQVKAGASSPSDVISHEAGTDLSTITQFKKRYVATASLASHEIAVSTPAHGQLTANTSAVNAFATVTLTATPDAGYVLSAVTVCKSDDSATTVSVTRVRANVYQFTMPAFAVSAAATFIEEQWIATSLALPAHATCKVYADGVLSYDGRVLANLPATVVYTADAGYSFPGSVVLTHALDTTVRPAVDSAPPADAESGCAYRYAEYNVSDDPTSGIKEWKSALCAGATRVAASASTGDTIWNAGWHVVDSLAMVQGRIVCDGDVRLILADGGMLTAVRGITVMGSNSLTIYGQDAGSGVLQAHPGASVMYFSGIGGTNDAAAAATGALTIHGGQITAAGGNSAAGLGGSYGGTGRAVTVNGGVVTATGGSRAAGIGGGYSAEGADITINGGSVTAAGTSDGAGIGGGGLGVGRNIVVNGGTVVATSGSNGAGIGGGSYAAGRFITVSGGTVTAQSSYGAGIGGGRNRAGEDVSINGGTVTASSSSGHGIGSGSSGPASARICAAASVKVLAGDQTPPATEIEHYGSTDLASDANFKKHYVMTEVSSHAVSVTAASHGRLTAGTADASGFVTLTIEPDAGYGLSSLAVFKTGDPATTVRVVQTNARFCMFAMPSFDVTVTAAFAETEAIPSSVAAPAHTTCQVYTNGVLSADGTVWSNQLATVVYTADAGYVFSTGKSVTNALDTTVRPAVDPAAGGVTAVPTAHAIEVPAPAHGQVASDLSAADAGVTVTLTATPDADYCLSEVAVYKAEDPNTAVTVIRKTVNVCTFVMPDFAVTVAATFVGTASVASAPATVAHTTTAVYTNGVLSADGSVWSNQTATVVYTCAAGYWFADGVTASTNALDTTVAPAANVTTPGEPIEQDVLELGDFNFSMMTFPRATGRSLGLYRRFIVMLSREMTGETLTLPEVAGFATNATLCTAYSYVIDIDEPGKTSAEIAQYIRGIAFNGCRDQLVRVILDETQKDYRTFYYADTGHYYQYVPLESGTVASNRWWTTAYARARSMSYLGRQGYLATVTSADEDAFVFKASAGVVGWLGGTTLVPQNRSGQYYESFTTESSNLWYWACGPECGTMFFDAHPNPYVTRNATNAGYVRNAAAGRYSNWNYASASYGTEPNAGTGGEAESCLTTLPFGKGGAEIKEMAGVYSWNDITYNNSASISYSAQGFVVEYGDQPVGDARGNDPVPGYLVAECAIRAPIVTFDAGAGAFSDGEATNAVAQLNAADGYALPTNSPTRAGYRLAGWCTNTADKSTVVMAGTPLYTRNDHTVYALWAEGGYTNVTVQTEGGSKISVSLPEEDLKKRGDADTKEANGNRVWENIVAGLDSDASVWTGARQDDNEKKLAVVAEDLGTPPADTGLTVTYYLDRVSRDGATRFEEESCAASPNALSVTLAHVASNAYYKVRLVITKDAATLKEIVSTNTLGVLKQAQAVTNAIVATPWGKLSPDADEPVSVASFIKTANLSAGDELRLYPEGALTAQVWTLDANQTWSASAGASGDATNAPIPRGCGVWLCRAADRIAEPYYLFGQLNDDNSKATVIEGVNLLGATGVADFVLADRVASPKEGDWILLPGTNAAPTVCNFTDGNWGYYRPVRVTTNVVQDGVAVPVTAYQNEWTTEALAIPPATGYWLGNKSGVAAAASADGTRLLYFRVSATYPLGVKLFDYAKVGVAKDGDATWGGTGKRYLKIRASIDATTDAVVQLSDDGGRRQATGWAEIPSECTGAEYTFYVETYDSDSDAPVSGYWMPDARTCEILASERHIYDPGSADPQEVTPWAVDSQPSRFTLSFDVTNAVKGVSLATNGVTVATSHAELCDLVLTNGDVVAFSFAPDPQYVAVTSADCGVWTDGTNWSYTVANPKDATCVVRVSFCLLTTVTYDAEGGAFADGSEFASVTLSNVVHYAHPADPVRADYVFAGWFAGWTGGVARVTDGEALRSYADHALYAKWRSATIPAGVTAFAGADAEASATTLAGPLTNADGSVSVTFAGGALAIPEHLGNDTESRLFTTIGRRAYHRRAYDDKVAEGLRLTRVAIPTFVTHVGDEAFYACAGVTGVTFSAARDCGTNAKVTRVIGARAFGGIAAERIVFPAGTVTKLRAAAFAWCPNLREIVVYGEIEGAEGGPFTGSGNGVDPVTVRLSPAYAADAAFVAALTNGLNTSRVVLATEPLGTVEIAAFAVAGDAVTVTFRADISSPWGAVNARTVALFYTDDLSRGWVGTGCVLYPSGVTGPDADGVYTATFAKPGARADKAFYRLTIGAER